MELPMRIFMNDLFISLDFTIPCFHCFLVPVIDCPSTISSPKMYQMVLINSTASQDVSNVSSNRHMIHKYYT